MKQLPNCGCNRYPRRTFLADVGMGFTGLVLGSMLQRDGIARASEAPTGTAYRLPDGRQVKKMLGPEWKGLGRPREGYFTRKTAEAELRRLMTDAERGTLPGAAKRTDKTFADACAEWLRYVEYEKQRAPSTLRDYRNTVACYLRPEFGAETPL